MPPPQYLLFPIATSVYFPFIILSSILIFILYILGENIVYNMGMQMGESQDNITMEMTMDMNYNGIKSMQSIDEIYNISIKDNSSNTEIGIDFNNKVEFVDSVEIEDFTDENSELLNEKDAQYIQQLLTQLTQLISESVMTGISESGNMMQNNMNGLGY